MRATETTSAVAARLQGVNKGFGEGSARVEVLHDIDIEAQAVAREAGVRMERARSMNDDPTFIAGLADVAETALEARSIAQEDEAAR